MLRRSVGFIVLLFGLVLAIQPLDAEETRIHLKNGDVITGRILEHRKNGTILLQTRYAGRLVIPKKDIRLQEKVAATKKPPKKSRRKSQPNNALDKKTLEQIKSTLKSLEQAINKNDDKALQGVLAGKTRTVAPLKSLKQRLGLSHVTLRASNGRKLENRVRVTVTVEQKNGKGDNQKTISGESFSFRRQGSSWKLILEQADLGTKLNRLSNLEQGALEQLRKIHQAQLDFRKSGVIDLDNDKRGEFGFLQEMAGVTLRQGKKGPRAPIKPLIDVALGASFKQNKTFATKGGYSFLIYLPGDNRPVPEKGPLASWLPVHADRAESYYICYAWPTEYGKTGQRTFVLYNKGQVYYTTGGTYTGTNAPESTAAFPTDAEDPHNLISDSIGGNPAYDDQVWLKLGTPFRRPLPRGIHLIDRLLLSHNIFPDGPLETATHDSAASAKPSKLSSRDKDRVEQAQREVQDLYIALRTYWRNNGRYPPSGKRNLLIYLDGDPKNGGSSEVYYLFKPDSRVQSNSFLDPWGRPYLYRAPAQKVGEPMVWSAGPDGKNQRGKGDDVEIGAPR